MLTHSQRTRPVDVLVEIARDLTASLASTDRYERLLNAVERIVPCDAACLLRLEDDELVPVASRGLKPHVTLMRFDRRVHPRFDVILRSTNPVRFPPDSPLEDPYDGLLLAAPEGESRIHACLGCALLEQGRIVGALTADALDPEAFDLLDDGILAALGALAGAAMHTASLVDALEHRVEHRGAIAREIQRGATEEKGGQILGRSASIRRLLNEIPVAAGSDLPVLITGETGVGKELVARMLHQESPRADEALIHVNCAALPESIAESELFGHLAGAFTGAVRDRVGKFELADGATLFLDEIGELPLTLQPKLLRVLQDGEVQRVGSDATHRVDVRVIAATNRQLPKEIERGRFRADLYHRLAVYPLEVPPLRHRREDIPVLASFFLDSWRRRLGLPQLRLSDCTLNRLCTSEWPGNVRELENVVSRAVVRSAAESGGEGPIVVEVRDLDPGRRNGVDPLAAVAPPIEPERPGIPLRERVDRFQREVIEQAVENNCGNWAAAARELGIHRSNLHHIARRLGLIEPRQP